MSNVVRMRAHPEEEGYQDALKWWRSFAHRKNLVVAGPTRLVGAERTFRGDSEDASVGPKDYKLLSAELLFADLPLGKKDKETLTIHAPALLSQASVDIAKCKAPMNQHPPVHKDERGRWDIMMDNAHRVGVVVRVGDGAEKHYILYLWDGAWYSVEGQPSYDLPMFNYPDLKRRAAAPVMIHEGPKAMMGALENYCRMPSSEFSRWLTNFVHVAWHGSDKGMAWTDWTPLRGRNVLIWSDMDEQGIANSRALARRIARMGGIVDYVCWSASDIEKNEGWDLADDPLPWVTRSTVRQRIQRVESPTDNAGRILSSWAARSFYDANKGEVYMRSSGYTPLSSIGMRALYGPDIVTKIAESNVNKFCGTDFRPGLPFGRMEDGRINLCPPSMREPANARPLNRAVYQELRDGWLARMIPDVRARKYMLRKAAWAIARPEHISKHMLVLRGDSGIGKSVLLDVIKHVAGKDRACGIEPEGALGKFNEEIANKSIVCLHEMHSTDLNLRQNASRLKELIGNSTITTEAKGRPRITHTNVIHWFAATNDKIPFALEHGNDRFYFVDCVSPATPRMARKRREFFARWVPRFEDTQFQDDLYAAAKWAVNVMSEEWGKILLGRAARQDSWRQLELGSMRPWQRDLLDLLNQAMQPEQDDDGNEIPQKHPPVFFGRRVINLIGKKFPHQKAREDIVGQMREFGFGALLRKSDNPKTNVQRRVGGIQEPIWCRKADEAEIQAYAEKNRGFGGLEVRSVGWGDGDG